MQLIKEPRYKTFNAAIIIGNAVWLILAFAAGMWTTPVVAEFMANKAMQRVVPVDGLGDHIAHWMVSTGTAWGYFILVLGTSAYYAHRWWLSLSPLQGRARETLGIVALSLLTLILAGVWGYWRST